MSSPMYLSGIKYVIRVDYIFDGLHEVDSTLAEFRD